MAAEGQSDKMASDMEVHMKQRCVTEFLHVEKMAPIDIHWRSEVVSGVFQQWWQWQWVTFAGADLYERSMQALVHCWQKCIANGGDYVEK